MSEPTGPDRADGSTVPGAGPQKGTVPSPSPSPNPNHGNGDGNGNGNGEGSGRRLGVYVCHCGGNISDYVDVGDVVSQVTGDPGVVVAREAMFTCSDATQQEIVEDIREQNLDGLVVASCSPKLHTFTFREVARRAGLNPYQYTQVNIREQCSWAHTDDRDGATDKAVRLVRAGINRTGLTAPLEPAVVDTQPAGLVVGGGVAGMRAALGLADIGLHAYLVERTGTLGGWVAGLGRMYPHDRDGKEIVAELVERIGRNPGVTVFTEAEVVGKSGGFGNYEVELRVGRTKPQTVRVGVGSVIVATGFDTYTPKDDEFGFGQWGVVTLPEFRRMVARGGPLTYQDRTVRDIAYIYCVGSRTEGQGETTGPHRSNPDCSRYCCTATVHTSLQVGQLANGTSPVRQYHLYRDIRTYGKYELLYTQARAEGSVFLRFPDDDPPEVRREGSTGRLRVTTRDQLSGGAEIGLDVDLVVLVTGMVPRAEQDLVDLLKLPVGEDGFLHEIHPKLRPVETVVDGVVLAGACHAPKNSSEAVASAMAAATQSASVLKKGFAALEPMVATVDPQTCTWCGACAPACPYDAITRTTVADPVSAEGERTVAVIDPAGCKGCGGCIPVCPENAIDLQGYTDAQVTSMIDGMLEEPVR
ncbi:MAG: FAD-dependent oxidoreductase [Kineosporiaceae bacterium]